MTAMVRGLGEAMQHFWRALRAGERPLAIVLAVTLVLSIVMLSGPFQRYVDGRDRVRGLENTLAALDQEVDRLERRRADLEDPENIEQMAREQLGFARPGEVPYTLVPPEVERPQIAAPRGQGDAASDRPWYGRVWDALTNWFS